MRIYYSVNTMVSSVHQSVLSENKRMINEIEKNVESRFFYSVLIKKKWIYQLFLSECRGRFLNLLKDNYVSLKRILRFLMDF